jgi:hypothetical protein
MGCPCAAPPSWLPGRPALPWRPFAGPCSFHGAGSVRSTVRPEHLQPSVSARNDQGLKGDGRSTPISCHERYCRAQRPAGAHPGHRHACFVDVEHLGGPTQGGVAVLDTAGEGCLRRGTVVDGDNGGAEGCQTRRTGRELSARRANAPPCISTINGWPVGAFLGRYTRSRTSGAPSMPGANRSSRSTAASSSAVSSCPGKGSNSLVIRPALPAVPKNPAPEARRASIP